MSILFIVAAVIVIFIVMEKITNRGGLQVNIKAAQALVKDHSVTILDVRTSQEFSQGHIQGARLLPVDEISGRLNELDSLKDKRILVYCHAGNRSARACALLSKNGFTQVNNLQGGITAWTNGGNKIVKGNS
jgi:rhodanese-related sulfurtransferase